MFYGKIGLQIEGNILNLRTEYQKDGILSHSVIKNILSSFVKDNIKTYTEKKQHFSTKKIINFH